MYSHISVKYEWSVKSYAHFLLLQYSQYFDYVDFTIVFFHYLPHFNQQSVNVWRSIIICQIKCSEVLSG